jgi:DNA mismatch repair protein MSH5
MSSSRVSSLRTHLLRFYVITVRIRLAYCFGEVLSAYIADSQERLFVIRPQKDFSANKGRSKLISLRLLSELPTGASDGASEPARLTSSPPAENAYDFMRRQRVESGDPFLARWNASIRMDNFASMNNSPLCVSEIWG